MKTTAKTQVPIKSHRGQSIAAPKRNSGSLEVVKVSNPSDLVDQIQKANTYLSPRIVREIKFL